MSPTPIPFPAIESDQLAELTRIIGEIDEFKGAWRALGKLAPERLRQLRKIATIESVGSSTRIEGAKLTDRQADYLGIPVAGPFKPDHYRY